MTTIADKAVIEEQREEIALLEAELAKRHALYIAEISHDQKGLRVLMCMLGRIENQIVNLSKKDDAMKDSLTQLNAKIATLETDYEQRISTQGAQITAQAAQITDLQNQLATAQQGAQSDEADIATIAQAVDDKIASLTPPPQTNPIDPAAQQQTTGQPA